MVVFIVTVIVYGLDQWMKHLIASHYHLGQLVPVIPSVVSLDYIRNPGGAFGILPNARWLFVLVAVVVVAAVVFATRKFRPSKWTQVAFGLIVAGALGNLTDRVVAGTVVDYVYLQIINFPVFNVADVAIDAGVIMLILTNFRPASKDGPERRLEED